MKWMAPLKWNELKVSDKDRRLDEIILESLNQGINMLEGGTVRTR